MRASNQPSIRWPTTRRVSQPTDKMDRTVATIPIAPNIQVSSTHPNVPGLDAATPCSIGSITGRLRSLNITNRNRTTTQVSQSGNRVSRPVMNRRCRRAVSVAGGDIGTL